MEQQQQQHSLLLLPSPCLENAPETQPCPCPQNTLPPGHLYLAAAVGAAAVAVSSGGVVVGCGGGVGIRVGLNRLGCGVCVELHNRKEGLRVCMGERQSGRRQEWLRGCRGVCGMGVVVLSVGCKGTGSPGRVVLLRLLPSC